MSAALPPFSCTFSPGMPELLLQLRCSIALTTYQAGKVIFLSAKDNDHLVQLPRQFSKPMGIVVKGNQMVLATLNEVVVFSNNKELAATYPKQTDVYDALFIPRTTFYTGELDIHDIQLTRDGILAVNTRFSCLARIDSTHNFTPTWKPDFITDLMPDDYCHLNGLAMENEKPRFVTALGKTTTKDGWRENKAQGGILMDVQSNEIILENLPMPHSPRCYKEGVYALLSGTGELIRIDVEKKSYEVIKQLDGFVRGMDRVGDYLFVGVSKLRTTSQAFTNLPISKKSAFCGVVAIHLPTGSLAQYIKYENSVEEIYDVCVLNNMMRPGILNHEKNDFRMALSTPEKTFWAKSAE